LIICICIVLRVRGCCYQKQRWTYTCHTRGGETRTTKNSNSSTSELKNLNWILEVNDPQHKNIKWGAHLNKKNREVDLNDPQHNISFRVSDPQHNNISFRVIDPQHNIKYREAICPTNRKTPEQPIHKYIQKIDVPSYRSLHTTHCVWGCDMCLTYSNY
jgi:hypothetical protein